ncbi:hypothetical protein Pla123a_45320 [Posidoniimonas polymericola]|uniref:Periplasmic repressor CpxP n=1 Tax=Posidoniimonas polymericola TaxID=2528002 RepID=A0A5C5XVB8_9BACT|nr:hypothetical protein [Posidoniimonas polymericola]TWT66834.1 hypothetical protein Pla123a_45320 [Posidoniimonas polymericola]
MRNMMIALTAVLVVALAATDVMAQGRGGRGGGFGGRGGGGGQMGAIRLLSVEKVAQEIGLTDEQSAEIREFAQEQRGSRPQRGNFRDMTDEERQKMRDERAAQQTEQQKAETEKLAKILDEGQLKRLEEIKLQIQGAGALLVADVQSKLGLSSETVSALEKAAAKNREEMMSLFRSGDRDGFREKATEMRASMEKEMLGLLTSTEQEQFTAMQGEKLDVSMQDLMGGRGQGGQNARGNRGNRGQGGRPQRDGGSELE